MNNSPREGKLQWHMGFQAALQIELEEDAERLEFIPEHILNKKSLQIDILVRKPDDERMIRKSIGRLFRRYNVVEYKGPTDYISINDFYHVMAYTCLYQSGSGKINEIKAEELTITFVCYHYPRALIKNLKDSYQVTIAPAGPGIYYVSHLMFPVQIILVHQLPAAEYTWLSRLRGGLKVQEDVEPLVTAYKGKEKLPQYEAAMELIIQANKTQFEEGQAMCNALRELFANELEEREVLGFEQGRSTLLKQLVDKKLKKGKSVEIIADELELSVPDVRNLIAEM